MLETLVKSNNNLKLIIFLIKRKRRFMKALNTTIFTVLFCILGFGYAKATPSTQIWIPSTDVQAFKSCHLGIDNYVRIENVDGARGAGMYDFGLTAGISPFSLLQAEVGVDYLSMGDPIYDKHPFFFNMKIGTPEDSLFKYSPAIAIGAFNFGLEKNLTNYNIIYGLIAKTFPIVGRVSLGYYTGNDKLLVDENGKKSNTGVLVSLDRQIPEVSDKLWFGLDYQGGDNSLGALSFGFSWAFSSNVSVILGYSIYNNKNALYNSTDKNANTFTTQLDINF
jgi:hypothetical protein